MLDHDRRRARRTRAHPAHVAPSQVCGITRSAFVSTHGPVEPMPSYHSAPTADVAADGSQLGQYLHLLELITDAQLTRALTVQAQRHAAGMPIALGELLVEQGALSAQNLVLALMLQQLDRLQDGMVTETARLGERLVQAGVISSAQCASALLTQMQFRQDGVSIPLGQILIAQGLVTADYLKVALCEQAVARDTADGLLDSAHAA